MTEKEIEEFGAEFQAKLEKYCPNFLDCEEIANLACELLPAAETSAEEVEE